MQVKGRPIDAETRCVHWHSALDVVAFRFPCCDGWWPCVDCHDGTAGHSAEPWPASRFGEASVLCGVCKARMAVPVYVACASRCPRCGVAFNPNCRLHWGRYFES